MLKKRALILINVFLFIVVVLLFLRLVHVKVPYAGQAFTVLDKESVCYVSYKDNVNALDEGRCCAEARKMSICERIDETHQGNSVQWSCSSQSTSVRYLLNRKQYMLCQNEGYVLP